MSEIRLWILSTCVPGDTEPCLPYPHLTEAEAEACADRMMRDEWATNRPEDPDTCEPMPYPGDWRDAQDILSARLGDVWGRWEISVHTLKQEEPVS